MDERWKRYSAPILPYRAEELTAPGFITFLQGLTHAPRHNSNSAGRWMREHSCIHWLLFPVWANWFGALKRSRFSVFNWQINWRSSAQVPQYGQINVETLFVFVLLMGMSGFEAENLINVCPHPSIFKHDCLLCTCHRHVGFSKQSTDKMNNVASAEAKSSHSFGFWFFFSKRP